MKITLTCPECGHDEFVWTENAYHLGENAGTVTCLRCRTLAMVEELTALARA